MSHEGLTQAQGLSHPLSLAMALDYAAMFQQFRREPRAVYELAGAAIALCTEQEFAYYRAWGMTMQGWAQVAQGQDVEGLARCATASRPCGDGGSTTAAVLSRTAG